MLGLDPLTGIENGEVKRMEIAGRLMIERKTEVRVRDMNENE